MGRQQMPKLEEDPTPIFGSAQEAAGSTAPVRVIQEGAPAAALPAPVPGYVPHPSVLKALADARKRLADLEDQATRPMVVPVPKTYRVTGLPIGGLPFIGKNGQLSRLRPEKILDERYFPIDYIRQQGFQLVEVTDGGRQLGTV